MNELDNLKRELEVIGKCHDVMRMGTYNGHLSQDVAISLMYLQGLHKRLKEVIDQKEASQPPAPVAEVK